jgi:hypothetical protein
MRFLTNSDMAGFTVSFSSCESTTLHFDHTLADNDHNDKGEVDMNLKTVFIAVVLAVGMFSVSGCAEDKKNDSSSGANNFLPRLGM